MDVVHQKEQEQKEAGTLDDEAEGKRACVSNTPDAKRTDAKDSSSGGAYSGRQAGAAVEARSGSCRLEAKGGADSSSDNRDLSDELRQLAVENQQPAPAGIGKGLPKGSSGGSGSVAPSAQQPAIEYTIEAADSGRSGEGSADPAPLWRVRYAVPREL
jgi:hypothetical protein